MNKIELPLFPSPSSSHSCWSVILQSYLPRLSQAQAMPPTEGPIGTVPAPSLRLATPLSLSQTNSGHSFISASFNGLKRSHSIFTKTDIEWGHTPSFQHFPLIHGSRIGITRVEMWVRWIFWIQTLHTHAQRHKETQEHGCSNNPQFIIVVIVAVGKRWIFHCQSQLVCKAS